MSIVIIFDIQEKMEDFIEHNVSLKEIVFNYYIHFFPYFANLFSSLFTFIAVIFFTSKMASHSEIIAMHASGVSFNRFLRPYMISAGIIAMFSLVLVLWIIPESNKIRLDFEERYIYNKFRNRDRNIHRQVRPGMYVYMESINLDSRTAYRLSIEKIEDGKLTSKLVSDYAKWDSVLQKWSAYNYYIREIDGCDEKLTKGYQVDTNIYLTLDDFSQRTIETEKMNINELNKFIEDKKLQGAENIVDYEVHRHMRYAFPFSTFILTLLGVSISNKKKRGGIGVNIGIGLGLSFAYILFMQVTTTFAINADVNPMLSVWIPNITYSIICIFLYRKARF